MGLLSRYAAAIDGRLFEDHWFTPGSVVVMPDGAGGGALPQDALKVSTVWRAVNVLAAGVATLPVGVFRRVEPVAGGPAGAEPARDEPWHQKIRLQPNPFQTSFRWRHQLIGQIVLGGNYYAQKIRARAGGPVEYLWPLDPERCRPIDLRGDGTIEYEYIRKNGQAQRGLTQADIFHARGFSTDGVCGVSVIQLMRDTVAQSLTAKRQRTSFLRKELRPSVVIEHPGALGDKAWEKLTSRFLRAYGGPSNAGTAMVLDEGMKIETFQVSPHDAQFIEGEHFQVEEFLRFIGVPGVLAGYPDKTATYASTESFMQMFVTHGLMPLTKNLEQEATVSLFGVQDEVFVRFNLEGMLRADSQARGEFYRVLVELGILTRNEVRELEGRNPIEGLDEPLTPLNMTTDPSSGAAPKPPRKPAISPRPEPAPATPDEGATAEHARGRELAILRSVAARVLRREVAALAGAPGKKGIAERFASDVAGWRAAVADFYSRHQEAVAEALCLDAATAAAYCAQHQHQVIEGGLAAVQLWGAEEVGRLLALAIGATKEAAC